MPPISSVDDCRPKTPSPVSLSVIWLVIGWQSLCYNIPIDNGLDVLTANV
jgi:hypothetical protein